MRTGTWTCGAEYRPPAKKLSGMPYDVGGTFNFRSKILREYEAGDETACGTKMYLVTGTGSTY